MSVYVPKVGDRVRATLGENVLVGTWGVSGGGLCNRIALDSGHVIGQEWDGWRFEQVVEVPTKFGAVIKRADGTKFTLVHPDVADRVWMRANDEDSWNDRHALYGGFTLLFEGVDE